jgi:hypothetical protein
MSMSSNSSPTEARAALVALLAEETAAPVAQPIAAMASSIAGRHAEAAEAVLFYGSALRSDDPAAFVEGVLDFYLVVSDYRRTYGAGGLAIANRLLPPNVFYAELPWSGSRLRAKYAIIAADQLGRRVAPGHLEPALWARFCQPLRLLQVRDETVRRRVVEMLADAVLAFVAAALPLAGDSFDAEGFWTAGFAATYRAELRAESGKRPEELYRASAARYDRILPLALRALGLRFEGSEFGGRYRIDGGRRGHAGLWPLRRGIGRGLHLLRLVKGAFTFEGGVDYILWKIERHTGRRPPISDWERRHPVLAAPVLLLRFYRAGAFR